MPWASILSAEYFDSVSNQPTVPDCMSERRLCQARSEPTREQSLFSRFANDPNRLSNPTQIQPRHKTGRAAHRRHYPTMVIASKAARNSQNSPAEGPAWSRVVPRGRTSS